MTTSALETIDPIPFTVLRNGFRAMCQWVVRMPETTPAPEVVSAVPLPQPRPKIDPPAAARQ